MDMVTSKGSCPKYVGLPELVSLGKFITVSSLYQYNYCCFRLSVALDLNCQTSLLKFTYKWTDGYRKKELVHSPFPLTFNEGYFWKLVKILLNFVGKSETG